MHLRPLRLGFEHTYDSSPGTVQMSPSAEEVPPPHKEDLRPETGRYRPCFKPVLITIAGRGRFGVLRAWLRSGDGWLCHIEYMNNGHGSTDGWYRFDPNLIQPASVPHSPSW